VVRFYRRRFVDDQQEAVRLYRALRALPRHGHHDERTGSNYIADVTTAEPPASNGGAYAQTWPHVWKLRRQLEEEVNAADAKERTREHR
jgi:hypothetical protein